MMNRIKCLGAALVCAIGFFFNNPIHANADLERVWVQFKPAGAEKAWAALERAGAEVHYRFDDLNAFAASVPSAAIRGLANNPNITLIEEDPQRYALTQTVPYGINAVQARDVWDANRDGVVDPEGADGYGRLVCLIDSGLDVAHEDFAGVNVVGGYPAGWNTDSCGHGTHVAGTITAANNSAGVVGVNPGTTSLYIVKIYDGADCGWVYSSDLVNAAQRCEVAGANIINMSLGGGIKSRVEDRAFRNLYNTGILSIAAAGNDGSTRKIYPASYNSVMSVAAIDENNVVADFSQQNSAVEIAAPGVRVLSTVPGNGYESWNGTSMATPHVAGVAALVWSADESKTNAEIRDALTQTALDLGAPGRDPAYGFGLVQAYDAWQWLGGGSGSDNQPPTASFIADCTDLTCSFNGSESNDQDGTITAYDWDFGDGNTASGIISSHTYAKSGSYAVLLTVTDNAGESNTATQTVTATVPGGDSTGPVISNVESQSQKGTRFNITWITDEPSDSVVEFTCCGAYSNEALVTSHSMSFRGSKGVLYEYHVKSTDASGNTTKEGPFEHQN